MDYKLELVVVPVSDVDRAKAFYGEQLRLRRRRRPQPSSEAFRIVQLDAARVGLLDRRSGRG